MITLKQEGIVQLSESIGIGVYTVAQASRLTRVAPATIRRWVYGYRYKVHSDWKRQPEVMEHDIPKQPGSTALTFLDLIELRFIHEFRQSGLSLMFLRKAKDRAIELTGSTHPFATNRFYSDGRALFLQIESSTNDYLDVLSSQISFREIIERSIKNLDLEDDFVKRWWPMGRASYVVLDPERAFGQPIDTSSGIRTAVLSEALIGQGSVAAVADWYGVAPKSVKDALEFEHRLVA